MERCEWRRTIPLKWFSPALIALAVGCGGNDGSGPTPGAGPGGGQTTGAEPGSGQGVPNEGQPQPADTSLIAAEPPLQQSSNEPYPYDPNITFDWPETQAGPGSTGGTCRAGRYVGAFDCLYVPDPASGAASPPIPVTGNIDMTLFESQSGEFLEVQNGRLEGTANGFANFGADLIGQLDCNTMRFDGGLINGGYSAVFVFNGTFEGPLNADYDPNLPGLTNGFWELHETGATSFGTCTGGWFANWTP